MITRLMAAALVAGTTCSFASADVATNVNPKTAQQSYSRAAQQKFEDPAAQKQRDVDALMQLKRQLAGTPAPAQMAQGGLHQGNPTGSGGTLAVGGGDDCAAADVIAGFGPFAFDTTAATTSPQQGTCGGGASFDVWFSWTAPSTGICTFSLCGGSAADTVIAAWAGSGCPGGAPLNCNDDSCGLQSSLAFGVTSGSNYMLQIGGFSTLNPIGTGTFTLGISTGPANDGCAAPTAIAGFGTFPFDNTLATTGTEGQAEALCLAYATTGIAGDVWYVWTAPSFGNATLSICNLSTVDTKVAAYAGSACPTSGTAIACNDDSCGLQSQITFAATSGSNYLIQLGHYPAAGGGVGSFSINAGTGGGPPNDDCSTPTAIAGNGTFPFDNTTATTGSQGQAEPLCLAYATTAVNHDIWFAWTAPSSGTATYTTCFMTTMDSKIAAYTGTSCPATGTALACNDDTCGLQSELTFPVTAGSTYLLQLGKYGTGVGTAGTFSLDVPGTTGITYICDPGAAGVIGCPCSNPPTGSGRGCDNSSATGGASITGSGVANLGLPTLSFTTANEKPTATTILLQGNAGLAAGLTFGQGVRCTGGLLKRLYVKTASGGSITAPNFGLGDLDIPTRSANLGDTINAGETRWYMAYYRDPIVLGTCPLSSTYNCTTTAEVLWQ